MDIMAEKQRHEERLMDLPNVVGVGVGERAGKEVIKVFVTHKVPASALAPHEIVPRRLGEWETDVEEIGVPMAQAE